jgi:8-oxo-dGTP pyrophosphatase MutT (NUDIX family)
MNLSILCDKDSFPSFVSEKLSSLPVDYVEKYHPIKYSDAAGPRQLGAGVVLLLHYKIDGKKPEYVFQLIKRSSTVSQSGDISCPGGMLHPLIDMVFSRLLATGLIANLPDRKSHFFTKHDKETILLIRLFLANALREAWEEIGLNPFNTSFLGALPCYSLSLFARTIFPVVCLVPRPYKFRLSSEVELIMEIPVSSFFTSTNYANLEIETPFNSNTKAIDIDCRPCLILPGNKGMPEILWGATYNIITNFLNIICDGSLPLPSSPKTIKKVLSINYVSGYKP